MNVPCPKCKEPTPIPASLRKTGVARTSCPHCKFAFVIRIGEPKKSEGDGPPPPLELKSIEGVKASAEMEQTAGEIGDVDARFVAADTRTSIVIDDTLKQEIQQIEQEEKGALAEVATVAGDSEAGGILSAATVIDSAEGDKANIAALPTEVDEEPEGLPDSETEQDAITSDGSGTASAVEAAASAAGDEAAASAVPGVEDAASAVPGVEAAASAVPGVEDTASAVPGVEAAASAVPGVAAPLNAPSKDDVPAKTAEDSPQASPQPARPIIQPPVKTQTAPIQEEVIPSYGLRSSNGGRAFGGFIAVCLIIFGILSLYVLAKNSWAFDMNDIGGMLSRAFGLSQEPSKFDGLEVSQPILRSVQIKDQRALVAEGVISNKGPFLYRFIYVRVKLQRHGRTVVKTDVPAGNVFDVDTIRRLTSQQWEAKLNPAGIDGQNTKLDAGETIAYQFVIPEPADYSGERYQTLVEVLKAETDSN